MNHCRSEVRINEKRCISEQIQNLHFIIFMCYLHTVSNSQLNLNVNKQCVDLCKLVCIIIYHYTKEKISYIMHSFFNISS